MRTVAMIYQVRHGLYLSRTYQIVQGAWGGNARQSTIYQRSFVDFAHGRALARFAARLWQLGITLRFPYSSVPIMMFDLNPKSWTIF